MFNEHTRNNQNLEHNLGEQGLHLEKIPFVMQYNKRDLPNVADVAELGTRILVIADGDKISVGKPRLESARVTAEVMGDGRGEKLLIFKHRKRLTFSEFREALCEPPAPSACA